MLLLRVELELERVHRLLQLLDFAARGLFVFVLVGKTRIQILQKDLTVWLHQELLCDNSSQSFAH